MPFVFEPSPQSISYLFGEPSTFNDSVTVVPSPPAVGEPVKVTLLTKTPILILFNASFNSSIASAVLSLDSRTIAPSLKLPSVAVPSSISDAFYY